MKKSLTIAFLFFSLLGSAQNLVVNGDIIKSDPTYPGTLRIYNPALNQINFSHSMFGDFLIVGSGNGWNSGSYSIASRIRGAAFSSSTANVPALQTEYGINRFNLYDGRSLFGQNVPDDGFSLVKVHGGAKFDSIRLSGNPGATGDVLTKQANGTYQPQTPSSSGSGIGASYAAVATTNVNFTGVSVTSATYSVNQKVVTCQITVTGSCPTINSAAGVFITMPPGYPTAALGCIPFQPVLVTGTSNANILGYAQIYGSNQFYAQWKSDTYTGGRYVGFTIQYITP